MSTATMTATTPYDTQKTYKQMAIEELRQAWQACEKHSLEFGKVCHKWRERLSAQGSRSNAGLRPYLDEVGIPASTAYYWIEKYEISIGAKEEKPKKQPVKEEPVEPSFEVETAENFDDLPTNPVPDPEPVGVVEPVIESVTTQLRNLFKGDIVIRPSNAKSGLQSTQGKYDVYGLTEKQVRQIAKVLA
jgi:hypothetical protein